MCETLDWRSVKYNADGNKINGSIGKQPAWIDYMTNFNKTYGNFANQRQRGIYGIEPLV